MEKTVTNEIPEKPKWLTLEEKLECRKCKVKSCGYRDSYGWELEMVLDCPKKAWILNILINWVSAIPVFFVFKRIFTLTSEKFFLSLLMSLIVLFLYDMFFVIVETSIESFSKFLEKKRKKDYEQRVQIIKEMKKKQKEEEKQEKEKEKLRFRDIENAFTIYEEFEELEDSKAIREKFKKPYSQMLETLKELCDDLKIEHFTNPSVKNLFKIYLPEVLETCKNFTLQYQKKLLTPKEFAMFRKLLRTASDKFIKVKQDMWQKETTNLYINMSALDEALSTRNENKEA